MNDTWEGFCVDLLCDLGAQTVLFGVWKRMRSVALFIRRFACGERTQQFRVNGILRDRTEVQLRAERDPEIISSLTAVTYPGILQGGGLHFRETEYSNDLTMVIGQFFPIHGTRRRSRGAGCGGCPERPPKISAGSLSHIHKRIHNDEKPYA